MGKGGRGGAWSEIAWGWLSARRAGWSFHNLQHALSPVRHPSDQSTAQNAERRNTVPNHPEIAPYSAARDRMIVQNLTVGLPFSTQYAHQKASAVANTNIGGA
jgi:hypothetical protein